MCDIMSFLLPMGKCVCDLTGGNHLTRAFFRCTSRKYADKFLKSGNIRLSMPKTWVESFKTEGDGRGDLLEGCFACTRNFDFGSANLYLRARPNVEAFCDKRNGNYYFRSKDVLEYRSFCLFGLDQHDFKKVYSKENKKYEYVQILSKKYFEGFSKVTREEYEKLDYMQKPVMLMITQPDQFVLRLKTALSNVGLTEDEWLFSLVDYRDKTTDFYIKNVGFPMELFCKDTSFSYQKEVRLVVFTKNKFVINKLNKTNGCIDLGPMEDIAFILDYYFDDMIMSMLNDKKMIYSLPNPITVPLEEEHPHSLMVIVMQAVVNDIPGVDLDSRDKISDYIKPICEILKRKHSISFDFSNNIFINNLTKERMRVYSIDCEWFIDIF